MDNKGTYHTVQMPMCGIRALLTICACGKELPIHRLASAYVQSDHGFFFFYQQNLLFTVFSLSSDQ